MKSLRSRAVALTLGVFATGIPVTAWAQERPDQYGWGHPMWGAWGAWGIGMMLTMIVFWGLITVGTVLGIRWMITQGRERPAESSLDILKKRYARGEINKEEYEAKKRDLLG